MTNAEQLTILKQGSMAWNDWRQANSNVQIDLSEADLRGMELRHVNLNGAILRGANLSRANLVGTRLIGADLRGARLNGADLIEANLFGATFVRAILYGANLSGAILHETVFSLARLGSTNFGDVDLSQAIGLEEATHHGPSTIGTDTVAFSKGKIPERFLRGCGMSDWEIEFAKLYKPDLNDQEIEQIVSKIKELRAKQPFQVIRLFISYSHADEKFVDKLEDYLTEKGVRCWRDNHELKAGRMETQIERAIREYQKVLLVLSSNSIRSDWVEHEVRTARELEKEIERDVLCPVALDDSWRNNSLPTWPKRIMDQVKEYFVIDFSSWKDDNQFEIEFGKLIDGLALFYKR